MKTIKRFFLAISCIALVACGNNEPKEKETSENKTEEQASKQDNVKGTSSFIDQIDSLTALIEKDPTNPKLYMSRAELWLDNKRVVPAEHDLKKALELDSTNEDYLLALGNHSALVNNTRNSRDLWEKCAALNPNNISCRIKLAELYFFVQDFEQSVKYANEVLELDHTKHLASFFKGMSMLEYGDTTKALRSFHDALEMKPDFVRAVEMLAKVYAEKDDELAIDYYKNLLSLRPNDKTVYFNIGYFYQQRKDYEKSLNFYSLASKVDPENDGIYYNMGFINTELKQYDRAIELFTKAIDVNNIAYQAYFARGYVYELQGNKTKSLEDYSSVLLLKPGYVPANEGIDRLKK